jgi:hypothetical protein
MTDSKIPELLAQLKELDPETYRDFREICAMTAFDSSDLDDPNITTPVYGWCLQGVIQDAIAARGWFFSLTYSSADKKSDVIIRERGFAEGREIWLLLSHICTKGHAEALLAAYIAAREAEREAMTDG